MTDSPIIQFKDKNLKEAILQNMKEQKLLDNFATEITKADALKIYSGLYLDNKNITSLDGIQYFKNLNSTDLSANKITDLTPLSELPYLIGLNLNNSQISDITLLSRLTELSVLGLNNNQISDITPLSELTELTHLSLERNQISNLVPLSKLHNLEYLSLEYNQISDLEPLFKSKVSDCGICLEGNKTTEEDIKELENRNSGFVVCF